MYNATAAQLAAFLRRTADSLDAADADLGEAAGLCLGIYLSTDRSGAPEHERVATVHTLARHLALPADRTREGSRWEYVAKTADNPDLHIQVSTSIDAPPRRCACGHTCTHTADSAARAA